MSAAFRVAIVGSGPSALYTAKYLLEGSPSLHIDILEKLCTPYGLVRYGVAPDHQEAKNVTKTLEDVLKSQRVVYLTFSLISLYRLEAFIR